MSARTTLHILASSQRVGSDALVRRRDGALKKVDNVEVALLTSTSLEGRHYVHGRDFIEVVIGPRDARTSSVQEGLRALQRNVAKTGRALEDFAL